MCVGWVLRVLLSWWEVGTWEWGVGSGECVIESEV